MKMSAAVASQQRRIKWRVGGPSKGLGELPAAGERLQPF